MNYGFTKVFASRGILTPLLALALSIGGAGALCSQAADREAGWRSLPLVANGAIDTNWVHVGWGGFVVEEGLLRTAPDPKGLGLLVYRAERFGNCQIRVVFKAKEAKSNSGVYVRLDDGILDQVTNRGPIFDRDASGKVSKASMEKAKIGGEREEGPWFAVHRGYEVQIADAGDAFHRTGAIYSLAKSAGGSKKAGEWRTMIITLAGEKILVDLDGKRVTTFDPTASGLPARKEWHEPKREPHRPQAGYIGLQNHDPGDLVWFKEIAVRTIP